ncbi:MAG: 2-oxoglutarate dehydrogenase E1 component, partial [Hyphomicrobiaceae bacterium]|nr:2-oxoglutarate dehydrogenase E1 component [Hyphomicrobiaceae bacterium]
MTRQEKNETFLLTSFLYGGNADYIEELYAAYSKDPQSVDESWRSFFAGLKDQASEIARNAEGPSWARNDWPQQANGELVSALDGDWGDIAVKIHKAEAKKAEAKGEPVDPQKILRSTRDSIHSIMMIRAYR